MKARKCSTERFPLRAGKEGPSPGTNTCSQVVLGTGQGNNSGNEVWLSLHSKEDEKPGQRWATIGSRSQSFVLREPVNVERPHPLPQVVIVRFRLGTWNETSAMQEGGERSHGESGTCEGEQDQPEGVLKRVFIGSCVSSQQQSTPSGLSLACIWFILVLLYISA